MREFRFKPIPEEFVKPLLGLPNYESRLIKEFTLTKWGANRAIKEHARQIGLNRKIVEHLDSRRSELLNGHLSEKAEDLQRNLRDIPGLADALGIGMLMDIIRQLPYRPHLAQNVPHGTELYLHDELRKVKPGKRLKIFNKAIETLQTEINQRENRIAKLKAQWKIK
ncbi:hypothetical protein HY989_05515 [Candidatus Micrarchaeota archaeon]|nr:hypothetical protein [Candidatus Micrarchaeota archaeon]